MLGVMCHFLGFLHCTMFLQICATPSEASSQLYLGQIIYEHIPQISATPDALGEVSFTGQIPQVTLLQVAVLLIVK